jgi:hypothetical protein
MRTRITAVLIAVFVALTSLAYAQAGGGQRAQSGTTVETKGVVSRGAAAQDPNIKTPRSTNKAAQKPAPPNKGGSQPTTRGVAVCTVVVDNWTGYWIDIYVDSDYSGTVNPWGDGYTYAIAGGTRLYGKATLDNGSTITWGPRNVDCPPNGTYTWKLTY